MLGVDRRAARRTWTASLVLLALYAAYEVRSTLLLFALAVFLAYMVHPLVVALGRHGPRRLSHGARTVLAFALLLAIVAGALASIGPAVTEQASHLADQASRWLGDRSLIDRVPLPAWLAPHWPRIVAFLQEHLGGGTAAGDVLAPAARQIGVGLRHVASTGVGLVLVPILAFLMVRNGPALRRSVLGWSNGQPDGAMWRGVFGDLDRVFSSYVRAVLLLALTVAVVYAVAFGVAGVPYALVLPIVAGLLELVPVAGPLTAALLTLIVAGLSGYPHLLGLAAFLAVYRLFQDYVLSPRLMGGGAALPSLWVVFGLLAGADLGGVAGVFFAVPALAAAKVLVLHWMDASRGTAAPRPGASTEAGATAAAGASAATAAGESAATATEADRDGRRSG